MKVNFGTSIVFLCLVIEIIGRVEFTNLKCITLDPQCVDFEYCHLKAFNRSFKYLSLRARIYQLPITEAKANFVLVKRFGGAQTTLYNMTIDACKFLKDGKSNQIITYVYSLFKVYSNVNHSCPIDHDIIMEKIPANVLDTHFAEIIPFARGEYLFQSNWIRYNINRALVNVYLSYT